MTLQTRNNALHHLENLMFSLKIYIYIYIYMFFFLSFLFLEHKSVASSVHSEVQGKIQGDCLLSRISNIFECSFRYLGHSLES